ncbi:MAG: hypothetical protein L3J39_19320 [Verrucomicrobiales bacterium]|nr:hypothetical protein [Verrucomicrobiales bacterium]
MGTVFEVDPVLAVDTWTMGLAINLEYHTAPPVLKPVVERKEEVQFHRKKITTKVTLYSGNYLLIGSWRPTGKAVYQEKDLMHVIFLTANVMPFGGFGLKEVVEPGAGGKKK